MPERLAAAAARWAQTAAGFVPSLPVAPAVAPSWEAHVVSTICVELVQPLAGLAVRWADDGSTKVLGRVEVKLRHLEAIGPKVGRDLGLSRPIADTRSLLADLNVKSTAPKREGGAPGAYFEVSVDADEARSPGGPCSRSPRRSPTASAPRTAGPDRPSTGSATARRCSPSGR